MSGNVVCRYHLLAVLGMGKEEFLGALHLLVDFDAYQDDDDKDGDESDDFE